MKKEKRHILFPIIRSIFYFLNIVAALALLLVFFAQFIRPTFSLIPIFSSLIFKYLLFANAFFVVFWLFIKTENSLISLIIILLNVNNIDRFYQIKATEKPTPCVNCVKVMSYNTKLFGLYDSEDSEKRNQRKEQVFEMLRTEKPDILCLQEYFYDATGDLNFITTDSLLSIMNLPSERCVTHFITNRNQKYYYGYATFCKYKILNSGVVSINDSTPAIALYIDIKYRGDTVRIYNTHLASVKLDNADYEVGKQMANNNLDDPKFNIKAKKIFSKLGVAYQKRQKEALTLRHHLKECPYLTIVCGDLNDSPNSYTYNKVDKQMKDAFRESGEGEGITYFGSSFPSFRIDYIFHSKVYKSFGFQVHKEVEISDHYPISCYISLFK